MGGGGVCCMTFLNRAPHPNAAKVFANWLLSKEGQISWQKYTQTNSLRTDIPKNDVHPPFVPKEGVSYFYANSYRYQSRKDTKAMRRIVDEAVKK